jgi:hypothetical protein
MASAFDAFDEQAAAAIILAFAEDAILTPRILSQYVEAAADTDRHSARVRGVFSAHAAVSDLRGQGRGGEFTGTSRLVNEQSEFWIARADAEVIGFRPAKGDLLTLSGRTGMAAFSIVAVHPTNMGDLNLLLVREDVPA